MTVPAPSFPVVQRTAVPQLPTYGEYREYLRYDFWYSCAYCSLTEIEAQGVGFEIDHFEPQDRCQGDPHIYSNLMWSCRVCNRCKSNAWPPDAARALGFRFVRPDHEDPADHFELRSYRLAALSPAGDWTLEVLDLNRKLLRDLRMLRERIFNSSQDITRGLRSLAALRADTFKANERQQFFSARDKVLAQSTELSKEELSAAVIRVLSHSPFLDPDPAVRQRSSRRREYLKRMQAIAPLTAEVEEG